jgi:uncharacterized membrane protein YbhN (UPF0104 family)
MRIERAGRFGMQPGVCTLSTILENALYMISGGLVGMLAILRVSQGLDAHKRLIVWPATILAVLVLAAACHPAVFYGLVNRLLRKMNKPQVPGSRQLRMPILALGVLGFIPCWIFGGLALWGAARCVDSSLALAGSEWFAGAYALSVIIGMASFLPGGLGIREAVLIAALSVQFSTHLPQNQAFLLAGVAAALQRIFQIVVEVFLGLLGGALTSLPAPKTLPESQPPT